MALILMDRIQKADMRELDGAEVLEKMHCLEASLHQADNGGFDEDFDEYEEEMEDTYYIQEKLHTKPPKLAGANSAANQKKVVKK